MMQTFIGRALSLPLAFLLGCGEDSPSTSTPQEYCNVSSQEHCDYLYRCLSQEDLKSVGSAYGFTDKDSCVSAYVSICEDGVVAPVDAQRRNFSRENADACVDAYSERSCSLSLDVEMPEICKEVVSEGIVAWKGRCVGDSDCAAENSRCYKNRCTDSLTSSAFEKDCSEPTEDQCVGLLCILLKGNLQNKTGICSAACSTDLDCGAGASCYEMDLLASGSCLSDCETDIDCDDEFKCVSMNDSQNACFVD
jgi:hypothetical protein